MKTLREFLEAIIYEELHPEIKTIAMAPSPLRKKQDAISKKIRELTARGESTGIEGNMPKGSSRAYLKHSEPENVTVDGTATTMPTGIKIAIRSRLDKYHNPMQHYGMALGNLQNMVENGDHLINQRYRTLTKGDDGQYTTNPNGIFPPIVDHDYDNNEWSHVGHADDITKRKFRELTVHPDYPKGISHQEFVDALNRRHLMNDGRYWEGTEDQENHLDWISSHPLVQKFMDYHDMYAAPPGDYHQIKNLGVWTHPVTGKQRIVARDSGFSADVQKAYADARRKSWKR